jgi:hypothetical protein
MAKAPNTMQLRFLQTLTEVASERNSTIVFPVPIDLIQAFMDRGGAALAARAGGGPSGAGTQTEAAASGSEGAGPGESGQEGTPG